MRRPRPALFVFVSTLLVATATSAWQSPSTPSDIGTAFESYLELLRQQAGIPGISGALVQDGAVVWERGLGFANVETRVRATPDTPYVIGDLTQTFSAVLLLQCVEQRRLELDAPVSRYGSSIGESGLTLRQALSHTSLATPANGFKYEADRYAQLAGVMEFCAPQPFRKTVAHRLLERLAMVDSVPGRDLQNFSIAPEGLFEPAAMTRYERVLERLAAPYRVDKKKATRAELSADGLNAATGIVSTVRDLARFDVALDTPMLLLQPETLAEAWSPVQLPDRAAAPTGLGWFVRNYRGTKIVWQFGLVPNGYSAMIVKVPARRATMILLANSDGLASPFQLEAGDVSRSLFASLFLRMLL